jgi:L-alanine-DL-glutamate epimerase-like enolase superfamily enzyme
MGQGEAAPLPGYSPDTLEAAAHELRENLPALLEGRALPELAHEAALESEVPRWIALLRMRSPAAHFAVETALLDLMGQRLEIPLAALLGASRPSLPISTLLIGPPGPGWAQAARHALERGVGVVKCKVGWDFESERSGLVQVARELGRSARLRIDANQAFSSEEAEAKLASLAPLDPELVEEPVRGGIGLALSQYPVPIAADETLQRPEAVEGVLEAIGAGRVRAVVLKPMALGGLFACLALARRAVAAGGAALVTHMHDGPVAHAATAALGLSLPGPTLHAGLDRHPVLDGWSEVPLPWLTDNAIVRSDRPGLGLDLLEPR